ncbi:hypothetical protein CS557_12585 [Acinetobacter junii]|uniref:hypothetical protein n=1 Tax=Acinetobacter junii TaxID=40215 RepID=UPI000C1B1A4C|nr:hypothetical protein [Acinetobacter junii]ATU46273.1 hypothetical protein CS557_12585 [Acinetobacter junii]
MSLPNINSGDSFSFIAIFKTRKTREPIEITSDMEISSKIVNQKGELIATCQVSVYPDQVMNKGQIHFEVDKSITQNWKKGSATLDIKLTINEKVKTSSKFQFTINKGIS